jgi:hypothetical protein
MSSNATTNETSNVTSLPSSPKAQTAKEVIAANVKLLVKLLAEEELLAATHKPDETTAKDHRVGYTAIDGLVCYSPASALAFPAPLVEPAMLPWYFGGAGWGFGRTSGGNFQPTSVFPLQLALVRDPDSWHTPRPRHRLRQFSSAVTRRHRFALR